ncbi:MAG: carbohydrate ABC transporter permease [Lachnospiraceae bacterium]|nr:carbohydrate ABC transporter permease [Lachnospiraceae bacterium]
MSKAITKNKIQKSRQDKIFDFIIYAVAVLLIVITVYPMYFIVIASISNPTDVSSGNILFWPKGINMRGYEQLLNYQQLWTGYKNTIIYTVLGTCANLVVNISASYALSRKNLVGKKLITFFYLIPMFFGGGLIPTYLIVRNFHLLDTRWVMILPFSVITYYIIVGRTFFSNNIPDDLWEAAQIDGCGNLNFFFKIVLPLSKAVIAVIALWSAVGHWNSYFNALIYLRDEMLQPLQIVLRNILINNQTASMMMTGTAATEARQAAELIKYGAIVVSSAPIMCMYPFVQKYFNQGVMIGAVKG